MKRFKNYIKEEAGTNMSLDMKFINDALKVTSFNLSPSDFTTTKHKKEIQYLFNSHFFPKFDISKTLNNVDQTKLNRLITQLKAEDSSMFSKLHNYNLKGVGPGEATLFFLINNSHLGGGSSAGVDLVVGSKKYEVKAVKISRDGYAYDFKLGGTVPLADIMTGLNDLRLKLKLQGSKTEINGTTIKNIKRLAPSEYGIIEAKYASAAAKYFKDHEIIFINNTKGSKQGNIEAVKQVKEKDILIERVTSGTIKPMVKL